MRLVSTLLALVLSPALLQAQNYGIATRPNFTAYKGGTLPTNLPAFSGSWSAVPAFPNLTFQNIMGGDGTARPAGECAQAGGVGA